ncbi:MAG: aminotransferase class I/II-fold pyridoxal phosphate-dependent enzyme [Bacteroidota bacterium]
MKTDLSNSPLNLKTAARLDGISEYYFSQKLAEIARLRQQGHPVLNLGIGSPDLPPPPAAAETLTQWAVKENAHGYQSYRGIPPLRTAWANFYQRHYGVLLNPEKEVLPLIGSKEGIVHLSFTYLESGDQVLVPNPGYPTYRAAAILAGATVVEYPLAAENGWLPDLDLLEKTDLSKVKMMWLNYPHMPSGAPASPAFFEKIIAFARRHGILLCHDNPYGFLGDTQPVSLLAAPGALEVAVELNSMSKTFHMAGWRMGVLAGAAERLEEVLRFKSNMDSGTFLPVQMATVAALEAGGEWFEHIRQTYRRRRQIAAELLEMLDCTWQPGQAGLFLWAKIPAGYADSFAFSDRWLALAHVFLTPGGIFGSQGDGYVRISLCSPDEDFDEAKNRIWKS